MMRNQYEITGDKTIIFMKSGKKCIISTESLKRVLPYTWCVEGTGYAMSRTGGKAVKMHRIILNARKGEYVDHLDGNPLNNVIENLRLCRKQENEFNMRIRSDNTSGYKGVCFCKKRNCYRAYITKDGKQHWLGYFNSKEDAARAYNKKAIELFGNFARLNQI